MCVYVGVSMCVLLMYVCMHLLFSPQFSYSEKGTLASNLIFISDQRNHNYPSREATFSRFEILELPHSEAEKGAH